MMVRVTRPAAHPRPADPDYAAGDCGGARAQHAAEYDGGVVTFDQCVLDKSKLGEVSNVIDCTFL